jgi:hypothetical protein
MNANSLPPAHVTWPMVAYAFIRELPYLMMTVGGAVVATVLVLKGDGTTFEKLGAVIGPAIVSALAKSQPTTSISSVGLLIAHLARKKIGL